MALTPGPWIERPTFPGLVTESPLTPGRYEVLDKQLVRAHKDAFYTLGLERYYVHHSRMYPCDVCMSSDVEREKREVMETEKETRKARDKARKASSRRMRRDNDRAYIDTSRLAFCVSFLALRPRIKRVLLFLPRVPSCVAFLMTINPSIPRHVSHERKSRQRCSWCIVQLVNLKESQFLISR